MTEKTIKSTINIKGQNLYIEYKNNYQGKPTIVFLHDSLGCVELWRDFPQKLGELTQCNVLVYDRLGYGKSAPMPTHERLVDYMETEADMLNELLAQLNINDAILFGHSDGGTIALLTAAKHSERIKAVVCEAAHIFVEEVTLKGIREAMEAYKTTGLPQHLQKYHGNNTDTLFRAWTETWTRSDFADWNIESFLPKIKCPLLFIQGEADEYGTLEQLKKTVAQVSGRAEEYIFPGIGHTPHKEAPDVTLKAAKDFIEAF
jgi:pimeloyl-ACP methyl ester carboxylesterase